MISYPIVKLHVYLYCARLELLKRYFPITEIWTPICSMTSQFRSPQQRCMAFISRNFCSEFPNIPHDVRRVTQCSMCLGTWAMCHGDSGRMSQAGGNVRIQPLSWIQPTDFQQTAVRSSFEEYNAQRSYSSYYYKQFCKSTYYTLLLDSHENQIFVLRTTVHNY